MSRIASLIILFGAFLWAASFDQPVFAQPKKPADAAILVEPLTFRAGEPLSLRTLVQRPPAAPGALSWSLETRRHRGTIATSTLSPDGKHIATGGMDGIIRIWDSATGEFQRALVGHGSYVYGLAWSPDGKTLASAGAFDGTAKLWDSATGMTLRTLRGHKSYTTHVAWSRDGKSLLVAGGVSGFMTLWDVAKAEQIKTGETGNTITGVAWGPGDSRIAVSGIKTGVQMWDARDAKPIQVFPVPGLDASSVAWSPDGKTLVGGAAKKTVVWDVETGKEKLQLDTSGVAVAYNVEGDTLAISSGQNVFLWKAGLNKAVGIPLLDARTLSWSPDGSSIFGTGTTSVKWSAIAGNKPPREIDVALDFPVQLTPGRPLLSGFSTNTLQMWDVATGKLISKLEGHTGGVAAAAWSKDGKLLATASADKSVRLWDATGKPIRTLAGHDGPVQCVSWADSKTLASGSADKNVRLWTATTDTPGKVFKQHKAAVTALAWSKDGKQIATGDEEHAVLIWTPENDKAPQSITMSAPVRSIAWSGNGKNFAVGIETGNVEVFTPVGGKSIQTFERAGSPPSVPSIAWAPDGITLLAARANHTGQVWRVGGANAVVDYPCMAPATHAGWSSTGNCAVLSEADRSVRVFDLATPQLRSTVIADGKQVVVVSAAGHYRAFDEATCELVYVVQTAKGQETLTPKEFLAKYRLKNNPAVVSLMDK